MKDFFLNLWVGTLAVVIVGVFILGAYVIAALAVQLMPETNMTVGGVCAVLGAVIGIGIFVYLIGGGVRSALGER